MRILVVYASRCGSTARVAAHLADELSRAGEEVRLSPVREAPPPRDCDAVLLGSAVRMGAWLPEASRYLRSNAAALSSLPLALFTVCLSMTEPEEERGERPRSFLTSLLEAVPEVRPLSLGFFPGAMHRRLLRFPLRFFMDRMKLPQGDFRDPGSEREWAEEVLALLRRVEAGGRRDQKLSR